MLILSEQSVMRSATDQSQELSEEPFQETSLPKASEQSAFQPSTKPASSALAAAVAQVQAPLDRQTHGLHLLSQNPAIYSGDLLTAAAAITRAAAVALEADRVSLWMYTASDKFGQVDSYSLGKNEHQKGKAIAVADHAYFESLGESLGDRPGFALENVSEAMSLPWVSDFTQHDLIFHTPGAFLEVPVRCRGEVVGALWYERIEAYLWTALDRSTALAISLLAAAAVDSQQQQALSISQNRQLKRETIEREQAEHAWQESQRFIQGIIDASTNILYVDSFADGSNFYISRWIKNVLGYEPEEIQKLGSQYLEQLVHADEKKHMTSERRRLAAINDGEVIENEYRFRHRQGNWRWLLCRETVFQRDRDGHPTQIFGTATDITKRKHAEVALKEFNQELERLASMDGLTKVANRRSFDRYLEQAWKNVGSGRTSLALILCDIDYFKNYNDTYGHQAGDVCLMQVAQAIERAVKRSTDLVARYGGEEFAVVLPNTSSAGVERVALEIQREIQQLDIPHSRSEVSTCITLSLGISAISCTKKKHSGMLIAAADQGLYQAKYEGRNRFCITEIETP